MKRNVVLRFALQAFHLIVAAPKQYQNVSRDGAGGTYTPMYRCTFCDNRHMIYRRKARRYQWLLNVCGANVTANSADNGPDINASYALPCVIAFHTITFRTAD